jgi:hypothetical protein
VALLVVAVVVTGCGANRDGPRSTDTAPSGPSQSSSPLPTSSTTASSSYSLADLAQQPCLALSQEDLRRFNVFIDARETNDSGKACQWGVQGGLVSFTPNTSTDQTTDAKLQHLTPRKIDGHRALLGIPNDPEHPERNKGCSLFVSAGANQSFRITAVPFGEDARGPDACTLASDVAAAIVAHLR